MDAVHDMGGMHGFGRVDVRDDAAFHDDWEKRVLGVRMACIMAGHGHGELRAYIEAIPAAVYLSSRYYERWARALETAVVDAGLVTEQEVTHRALHIASGGAARTGGATVAPETHDAAAGTLRSYVASGAAVDGLHGAGDRVRVKRMSPPGHTRCPRYVRGVEGIVERVTDGFRRPDPGEHPVERTYTVRFAMRDLWGDEAENGFLHLDLWEGYLE